MEEDIKKVKAYLAVLNEENILYKKEDAIEGLLELYKNLIARNKELTDKGIELGTNIDALETDLKELKEKNKELEEENKTITDEYIIQIYLINADFLED